MLKRTGLERRTPLRPGKPLSRQAELARTELKRRKPMKRAKRRGRGTPPDWWKLQPGELCACGCGRPAVHVHHIIGVQQLRRVGITLWSRPNRMAVAAECHERHHHASRRLPLPLDHPARDFARHFGLDGWLERHYPS